MARLKDMYKSKIASSLRDKYAIPPMAIPHLKRSWFRWAGQAVQDKKILKWRPGFGCDYRQKPMVCIAQKSVRTLRCVRRQDGLKVTLEKTV